MSVIVAVTVDPLIVGVPRVIAEPSSLSNTISNVTLSPILKSAPSFSIFTASPYDTLYCFPPVFITACVPCVLAMIYK